MPKRSSVIASVVVGIALVGGGVVAAKEVRDNINVQQACSALAPEKTNGGMVRTGGGEDPAVIMGDSYTASEHLDNRSDGWAYKLAAAEHWDAKVAGIGSTGFVNQGPCGGDAYANRMSRVLSANPKVLVVQGGLNDWKASPKDVETAADMLLKSASAVPTLVVVGPPSAPARAETLPEIDAALARAAKANGAKYISALDWDLEFLPDRLHLTPAGHTKFAELAAKALT